MYDADVPMQQGVPTQQGETKRLCCSATEE